MPADVRQLENAQIHRRKSSQDQDETRVVDPNTSANGSGYSGSGTEGATHLAPSPSRIRVGSMPSQQPLSSSSHTTPPPSAGHHRTSFTVQSLPNGRPSSPFRSSFSTPAHSNSHSHSHSHSRTRSISTPFSPPLPSPLSASFPHSHLPVHSHRNPASSPATFAFPTPPTPPDLAIPSVNGFTAPAHNRRHSRLHSRNLSLFFPRPDSLPQPTIEEDGTRELVLAEEAAPVSTIPSAEPSMSIPTSRQLGAGFTFGGRPPNSAGIPGQTPNSAGGTSRRGHHHKHSLSHNFFSFLEPGTQAATLTPGELHTQPTPIPVSPWNPISPFPSSAAPTKTSFFPQQSHTSPAASQAGSPINISPVPTISSHGLAYSVGQFVLGAWLWVNGQQIGSLGCTGLGYWVVFDAMGIAIEWVVPGWLATGEENEKTKLRRSYGNARIETVLMFAQAVYLMFASVYVCKETVEHLLLSAGEGVGHGHGGGGHAGAEGHHHHRADEDGLVGVDFPLFLTIVTLLSLMGTAFLYENHLKLVNIVNNHIPPFSSLIRSITSPSQSHIHLSNNRYPEGTLASILSNPFVMSPLFFCLVILGIGFLVDPSYHRIADLVLASIETIITFKLAYRTCVVLGTVLLQTSPPRGLSGGRMEAFLRAMKEVERHPQVLHLPAPHIWQVTPSYSSPTSRSTRRKWAKGPEIVVTLELHVRADLDDNEVMKLTKWTWEKCVTALEGRGVTNGVEVTVGIVRG